MGYLIKIKYHPKKDDEDFGFDLETKEEKEIKLGEIGDDISHSKLAMTILKQLSRRDIYVFDVEAIEFVKKVLKVKESKNGIIIGQKKYTFDDAKDIDDLSAQVIAPPPVAPPPPVSPARPGQMTLANPPPVSPEPVPPTQRVIRKEFFEPNVPNPKSLGPQFAQMGLTVGKQYSIINENSEKYTVINDTGGRSIVPLQHFSAVSGEGRLVESGRVRIPGESSSDDIPLSFGREVQTSMRDIR